MEYVPTTPEDAAEMLRVIGVGDRERLFQQIPARIRLNRPLELPPGLSEPEVVELAASLAARNRPADSMDCFLGAGRYAGFIPSVVDYVSSQGEFATAYTPYQAEASQGLLQAAFEYQTMICELTGMDVSNASHFDGATALAEAVGMSVEQTGRTRVLLSEGIHPAARHVVRTFFQARDIEIVEIPLEDGRTPVRVAGEPACVAVQQPNFLGFLEDLPSFAERAHAVGALAIASVEPISLGLLKPPGEAGFDIAVGDGQPLGLELMYGGPTFGFLAARADLIRRMPGRIVGEAVDREGRRGFVLTLQTREQHIRRERATSNICTNQALMALRAAAYLATVGKQGLPELARVCHAKALYLADRLREAGLAPAFEAPFFREFPVRLPRPAAGVIRAMLSKGFLAGFDLGRVRRDWSNLLLVAVTETTRRDAMDRFARALRETA